MKAMISDGGELYLQRVLDGAENVVDAMCPSGNGGCGTQCPFFDIEDHEVALRCRPRTLRIELTEGVIK